MKNARSALRSGFVLLAFLICATLYPQEARADLVVISTTISGPLTIVKGGTADYTLTVMGTGAGAGTTLQYSVLADQGDEPPVLIDDTPFTVIDDAAGMWTFTTTFRLKCTPECNIMGSTTALAVSPAMVSALIEREVADDVFRVVGRSNTLTITCITAPDPGAIPEPSAVLLLGTGLAGIAAKVRRRRKASNSGGE